MGKPLIINDPIYGFIKIQSNLTQQIIAHPYFQRLRRIKQLGLTNLVFPGATHTRFEHSIGALHLMQKAIEVLRNKNIEISDIEEEGVINAVLLHDIGHGPYSHASEKCIVKNYSHENLTLNYMNYLNIEFNGALDITIKIFTNKYRKKFLNQLVSGQLDIDRLDYLRRDSFFTGVVEGEVNTDRIITTLDVNNNKLLLDFKAIYPIESFLIARRIMYWQVYFHKAVVSAEFMLINIFERAREIIKKGSIIGGSDILIYYLINTLNEKDFKKKEIIEKFSELDDYDIFSSIKQWAKSDDKVLSELSNSLINRNLYKIEVSNKPIPKNILTKKRLEIRKRFSISEEECEYLVFCNSISNHAYNKSMERINIRMRNGNIEEITNASDQLNIKALSAPVTKYFMCYPR